MNIVIKFGTSTLINEKGEPRKNIYNKIASTVTKLNTENRITIVASGAAMIGSKILNLKERPKKIDDLQVASSLGQVGLMNSFIDAFDTFNVRVAQVLLTKNILEDRSQYLNTKTTLNSLYEKNIIPVINENDTVSTEELSYGDNDRLSAMVAQIVEADKLIIFTDTDGLFSDNPEKFEDTNLIKSIEYRSEQLEEIIKTAESKKGVGGFTTKILAGQIAGYSGIDTHITKWDTGSLEAILNGKKIGTYISPSNKKVPSRKLWIGFGMVSTGEVTIDNGAKNALVKENASLLYKGIINLSSDIKKGDCVTVFDLEGSPIAKGISDWTSVEMKEAIKTDSKESSKPVLHKDNLIIL